MSGIRPSKERRMTDQQVLTKEQFPTYEQLAEGWKQMQAENERLKQQLTDTKADYLRRHKDAVDRYEEIQQLREFIEKKCCGSGVVHDAERWRLIDAWRAEKPAHETFEQPAVCKGPPPGCPYI